MQDFVAYPSPWRIAPLVLASGVFVSLGLWMGGALGPPPSPDLLTIGFGWFAAIFFGLCGMVAIRRLFDRREQLRIGPLGVRSAPWSDDMIQWSQIAEVTTWSHAGQKAIILRLHDGTQVRGRGMPGLLAAANRPLTGGDIAISLTGTDRRFEDAVLAIARFRRPPHIDVL